MAGGVGIGLVGSSLCLGKQSGKFRALQISTSVNAQALIERLINFSFSSDMRPRFSGFTLIQYRYIVDFLARAAEKAGNFSSSRAILPVRDSGIVGLV